MQEHTNKDPEVRGRSTPIHIVPTTRQAGANADTLREVHMSLVRAEQNLYNLVQASHANGQNAFGFSTPNTFSAAGYAAPAFPPGYAPSTGITQPTFGFATQPNGIGQPLPGYGQPPAFAQGSFAYPQPSIGFAPSTPATPWTTSPWNPLTSQWNPLATVTALPGVIAAGLSAISGVLAASVAALPGATNVQPSFTPGYAPTAWAQSRTPACDITDEGKAFVCQIDLPGLRSEQVELLCLEQAIIVSALREVDGEAMNLVQAERGIATQQRTVVLPAPIQPGGAKAALSNGILTVTLPKVNPTEGPRRIKVQG